MSTYRIAVIPGDGIGREVVPEGQRVLEAVARRFGFQFEWVDFDWSCERFHRVGEIMPADGLEQLSGLDAIYFGAVGIKKTRYAIHAGLIADVVGIMASVMVCRWLLL